MASWQSKFIKVTLRYRHLLRGKLKQTAWDENTSIPAFREMCEKNAAKAPMPAGVAVVPVKIDGLPDTLSAEWLQPAEGCPAPEVKDAVIFYTHGGGYVSGSCSDHRALVAKIVAASGIRLLLFEYRLAPEFPYPAAVEDTLTAYRWLLRQIEPGTRVIIAGESAGGGLCLAALLAFKDVGLPLPICGVAISPMTDLAMTGASHRSRSALTIEPPGMTEVCIGHYIGKNDPRLPWISPLYGDLAGLPPLLIIVGSDEVIRDNSILYTDKARAAGVDVTLRIGEGQVHVFPLLPDFIPEAKQGLAEIASFLKEQLAREAMPA